MARASGDVDPTQGDTEQWFLKLPVDVLVPGKVAAGSSRRDDKGGREPTTGATASISIGKQ